jgi:opacity protein-like surface antigen
VNTVLGTVNVDEDVPSTMTYAFQVGYMWHSIWGAEFIADFAPDVGFTSQLLASQPHVNSYMGNIIAALPIGERVHPYISGGFGSVGISADVFTLPDINGNRSTITADRSRWGYDIGGGIMAFADRRWGVRGDVRYFRGSSDDTFIDDLDRERRVTGGLLSDLGFWHGTLGLAYRW